AQEQTLRENLFERLIRGDVYYPGTLKTAARYLPDFPDCCRMALLRLRDAYDLPPDDFSKIQLTLLDIVERVLPPEAAGHIHFTSNLLVLALPVPPADDRGRTEAWLARLGESILEETGISIHTAWPRFRRRSGACASFCAAWRAARTASAASGRMWRHGLARPRRATPPAFTRCWCAGRGNWPWPCCARMWKSCAGTKA
ncbi:MAG TPA: hypothetical protein PKE04_14195, partial [Clostridia bacterium]|nr:hypothetical protein [Clostridia bacterium]